MKIHRCAVQAQQQRSRLDRRRRSDEPFERQRIKTELFLRGDFPQEIEVHSLANRLCRLHQFCGRRRFEPQHHRCDLHPDAAAGGKFKLQVDAGVGQDRTSLVAAVFFEQNVHGSSSREAGDLTSGRAWRLVRALDQVVDDGFGGGPNPKVENDFDASAERGAPTSD